MGLTGPEPRPRCRLADGEVAARGTGSPDDESVWHGAPGGSASSFLFLGLVFSFHCHPLLASTVPFFLARSVAMDRVTSSLGRWVGRSVGGRWRTGSPRRLDGRLVGGSVVTDRVTSPAGRPVALRLSFGRSWTGSLCRSLARPAGRSWTGSVTRGTPGCTWSA